jgi:hypothetical protein
MPAIDIFVVVSLPTWPTTNTGQNPVPVYAADQVRADHQPQDRQDAGLTVPPTQLATADEVIERRCCLLRCMSPSLRLELTRLFFKLGAPGRMSEFVDAGGLMS